MGDFMVIGVVGEAIRELLRKRLLADVGGNFSSLQSVTPLPPNMLESTTGDHVSLFLYHIVENGYMKNQPMERIEAGTLKYPPLCLNLYYLLTPYAGQETQAIPGWDVHTILGRSMQAFHDNASLDGPALRAALEDIGRGDDFEGIKEIRIILNPVSIDDMNKIWTSLTTPLRISVCYEVRVVTIESRRSIGTGRVVEKNANYYQMT